jgi:hypothetical protein
MYLSLRVTLSFAPPASPRRADIQYKFKQALKKAYRQPETGDLFDMATGKCLPHSTVVASHIFAHKWSRLLPHFTSLSDINDLRNGFLFYKPVEAVFDKGQLCVEVNSAGDMVFRLLDETIRDTALVDMAFQLRGENDTNDQYSPHESEEQNLHLTFGDLDGKPLEFPQDTTGMRPSKRLVGLHAVLSMLRSMSHTGNQARRLEYSSSDDPKSTEALRNLSHVVRKEQKS